MRIRIQFRIQGFDDQKLENFTAEKDDFLLSKLAIYLSLGLHEGRPSCRRILQPPKENTRHLKTWNSFTIFYFCG
jgi:hypothetical protein